MKQIELAEKVGCVQPHLSNIITGKRNPSWRLAKKIAKVLGTTPEFWLEESTTPEEKREALNSIMP